MPKTATTLSDFQPKKLAEFFEFLDELRDSGVTNMYGARPYLTAAFPQLSKDVAAPVVSAWMRTFSEEPALTRANAALSKAAA